MYIIQGKSEEQTRFKAMDLDSNTQVNNLTYATRVPKEKLNDTLIRLKYIKPTWQFKTKLM